MIKNFGFKLPLVTSKLTVAKLLDIYNFIKNVLHQGRPVFNLAIFFNSWKTSGQVGGAEPLNYMLS